MKTKKSTKSPAMILAILISGMITTSLSAQCDFSSDFETGTLTGWTSQAGTNVVSTQQVHTGNYALKMELSSNYPKIISNQSNFGFGIYTAWFYVTGPYSASFLRFHYQNSNNYYQIGMMPINTDNPNLTIKKRINGTSTMLANTPPIFHINTWFKMTVERYSNGDINVFINDTLQLAISDTSMMIPDKIVFTGYDYTTYMDDFCYEIFQNNVIDLGADIVACEGDTILLDAGSALQNYVWNNGLFFGNTLNVSTSGIYFVSATDTAGNIFSDTILVTINLNPIADLGNDTTVCPNDTLTLNSGSFGFNYLWSTGETSENIQITAQISTEYSITVENNSCFSYDTIMVYVVDSSFVNLISDTVICDGDSLVLYPGSSSLSYSWSTDQYSDSIIVTSTGMYAVTATNVCGMVSSDSVYVQVLPIPYVNLGNNLNICDGDTFLLDCNVPNSTYLWSTGATTQAVPVFSSGLYYVFVTNVCGMATDFVNINLVPSPLVNLGNDTSLCQGDTIYFDAQNPGLTYNWTTGDTSQTLSIVPLSTAYYSLTVSDMACTASDTVLVEVVPLPLVDIGADTIICVKDTVILDAGNPGASYLWSNSDTAQSIEIYPIIPQFIWVDVSQNGCSTIDSFYVDVFPDPIADIGNDTSVCIGESLILNAGTPGCTYFWSTGESSQEILISSPDFYNVEIYNQCNEFDEDTIYVGQFQLPLVNLGNDTSVNFGDTISLDAGGGFLSYNWSNGLNGQIVLLDTGILLPGLNSISVLITDSNFCTNSDTLLITYQTSQIISLPQGWSIISTYIDPVDPNVELVMSSLMPNLIIAKNGSGNVYWPLYSLNGIGNIIIGEGYQIHMTSLDILEVLGTEIVPENTPFPISQGWSIIGYLRNSPAPADSLLAPIVNYIVIVKNSNGMIYWPIFGLNNIGNMNPGEGYQIKMVAPVNFTYQAN